MELPMIFRWLAALQASFTISHGFGGGVGCASVMGAEQNGHCEADVLIVSLQLGP
jgi:hypothetical protein